MIESAVIRSAAPVGPVAAERAPGQRAVCGPAPTAAVTPGPAVTPAPAATEPPPVTEMRISGLTF